jgi:hypothetical protein
MRLLVILGLSIITCACDNIVDESEGCFISDANYLRTTFDCIEYSVDYTYCAGDYSRKDCVDFAPESTMGHCISENTCE